VAEKRLKGKVLHSTKHNRKHKPVLVIPIESSIVTEELRKGGGWRGDQGTKKVKKAVTRSYLKGTPINRKEVRPPRLCGLGG